VRSSKVSLGEKVLSIWKCYIATVELLAWNAYINVPNRDRHSLQERQRIEKICDDLIDMPNPSREVRFINVKDQPLDDTVRYFESQCSLSFDSRCFRVDVVQGYGRAFEFLGELEMGVPHFETC
jgi:hypothetical protein